MNLYFKDLRLQDRQLIEKSPFPQWINPMLATLTDKRFSDPDWIFETKFDGERALTFVHNQKINILSRNQHNLSKTYPELVKAFEKHTQLNTFVIDGEIVAFDNEITSFSRLQQRLGLREISLDEASKMPVFYYVFDILYCDGYDLRQLPLSSRKVLLDKVIQFQDPIRRTEWRVEHGEQYFEFACDHGWEGIIAKNFNAPYQGRRSRDWLKFKCHRSQELIIIGYTAPKGQRQHFGALLVGYYKQGKLSYAGKVGTGFSTSMLEKLKHKMDQQRSLYSPITEKIREADPIVWLNPVLVGEFEFTEWTTDGKLRHPRFKGLREDKAAKDVIKEEPQ